MTPSETRACLWCERPFPGRRGGSPQRFCCSRCRTAFWSALRRWAEKAVAVGALTVDHLRGGDPAACTLLPTSNSPAPISELQKAAAGELAELSGEIGQLLDDLLLTLLDLPGDGWPDLAAALPEELFRRVDRYMKARLA